MRFYLHGKQSNHIEIRKTKVRSQGAVFFFFVPVITFNKKYFELKQNKKHGHMNVYTMQWLWLTFIRRTFKKRAKK